MGHSTTDYEDTEKDNYDVNLDNARKCLRKGDTIYYGKPENINMIGNIEKIPIVSTTASSFDSDTQGDKILSGESLYKTFTFEQSPNDEETEKCIAFWKSVMDKNLAPIKCAIIERKEKQNGNINNQANGLEKTNSKTDEASTRCAEENNKLEQEIDKVHQQYRTMWRDILKEIQKKKINEVKLNAKSRCKFCESIATNTKDLDKKVDKEETLNEIEQLNNWTSPGWKRRIGALSTRSSDVSSLLKAKQIGPRSLPVVGTEKRIVEKDIKSSPDVISWLELANKQNREKYTFKNIIEEKNQTGAYSQWRSNSVKAVCSCGFASTCDCNKNPAVLKVVSTTILEPDKSALKSESHLKPVREDIQMPPVSQALREKSILQLKTSKNSSLDLTRRKFHSKLALGKTSSSDELVTVLQLGQERDSFPSPGALTTEMQHDESRQTRQRLPSILRKSSISITRRNVPTKIQCTCSSENCDCSEMIPIQQDSEAPHTPPPRRFSVKRNSLELLREKVKSKSNLGFQHNSQTSEESTEPLGHKLTSQRMNITPNRTKKQKSLQILFSRNTEVFESTSDYVSLL